MRSVFRRFITFAIAMLALAPGFAQSPAPAAAAVKVYVDDTAANNSGIACPNPVGTTIQEGVDNAPNGATIYVCQGVYSAGAAISSRNNLKLIAKGNVSINVPGGYNGMVFDVFNSPKITLQGFIINGGGNLGASGARAINYDTSSGSIRKNYILHWREANQATATAQPYAIIANGAPGSLSIDHNTVYDFQYYGIYLFSYNGAKVTHNYLVATSGGAVTPSAIVNEFSVGGAIAANTIQSNYGLYNASGFGHGIYLNQTTSVKVTGNTLTGIRIGITLWGDCSANARKNTISGNKLYETYWGIEIHAAPPTTSCSFANNVVSGNKVYVSGLSSLYGVSVTTLGSAQITGTVIKSNTFGGFGSNNPISISGAGVTGTVQSKNKKTFMPPPGK